MRILHAGNANFGFVMARELRKKGIESDLLVAKQLIVGNGKEVNDPLNLDKSLESYPDWMHFYDLTKNGWKRSILKTMRKYDLIHAYMELPIFAMFSMKPYLAQSGGDDLRDLAFEKSIKGFLLRQAYNRANAFVYVWPPHKPYVDKLGLKNAQYIPRAWDTSQFTKRIFVKSHKTLTVFHPTGQDWNMKGNDKFLKAFIKLCKEEADIFLYYIDWGKDSQKAKEILDLPSVRSKIEIIKGPISREKMSEYMEKSDILVDQFNSGSFTRTGIESFMFGIPLMLNLDEELHRILHGELPPVISTKDGDQIYDKLKYYINARDELVDLADKAYKWGIKHFNLHNNVEKYIKIYENILRK